MAGKTHTTRGELMREELDRRYGANPSWGRGRAGDTRGMVERVLGTLNRKFVSSVPHQERRWDDSPERRATQLREQEAARERKGLNRPIPPRRP